jgi:nitrite reductase (NADH) small subunit
MSNPDQIPDIATTSSAPSGPTWIDVGSTKEVQRKRSLVVAGEREDVAVFWHDGKPCALANICVHSNRELVRGMIFKDRVVCPGHQWAFDLETGHCAERERTQPVYTARVVDDRVEVNVAAPTNAATLQTGD